MRIGTCGALAPELELGQLLIVREAICDDGTSRALGAGDRVASDPELVARLEAAAGAGATPAAVVSSDLFYGPTEQRWTASGAVAVEMEAATLLTLGARDGFAAAALLLVTDLLIPQRQRIDPDSLREGEYRLGALAARALAD